MTKSIVAVLLSTFAVQKSLAMPANPWLSYVGYDSGPTATAATDYPQFTPDPTAGPYGLSGTWFAPSGTGYPVPTNGAGLPAGVPVVDPFVTTANGNEPVETAAPVVPGPGGPFGAGGPSGGGPGVGAGPGAAGGPGSPGGGFGGPGGPGRPGRPGGFGGAGHPGGRPFGGRPGFGRPGPPPFARDADNLGGAGRA